MNVNSQRNLLQLAGHHGTVIFVSFNGRRTFAFGEVFCKYLREAMSYEYPLR